MAGEEVPERVKKENKARWKEYKKLRKMEKRLQEKILGGPKQRPTSQEQGMWVPHRGRDLSREIESFVWIHIYCMVPA